jgi:hypothetical protein
MAESTKVVGKALYLEFRRGDETNQIIITPEAINSAGKYVPITTYRRRISKANPRKTWKQMSTIFKSEIDPMTNMLVPLGKEHALATVADRISYTDNLFNQLIAHSWTLHKQAFVVEVTNEDLEDIRLSKTPYKILGRITRCRRTLNFGESLFNE